VLDDLVVAEPDLDALAALPPALARLVLVEMADAPIGSRLDEILALSRSGTATLDLGGGLRAVAEYGRLRFDHGPVAAPAPAMLPVPGSVAYGDGRLVCEPAADGAFDADALGARLAVRPWQAGDRMRLRAGSRTLQDLFTDQKVPRERRAHVPVVVAGDEIAWVPGVAAGERFVAGPGTRRRVELRWP
jgi:tRNA(Ile)-lysidine synthase